MCAPSPPRTLGTSSIGDGGWPPAECDGREEAVLQLPTAPGGRMVQEESEAVTCPWGHR